jgi:hypothetical protein
MSYTRNNSIFSSNNNIFSSNYQFSSNGSNPVGTTNHLGAYSLSALNNPHIPDYAKFGQAQQFLRNTTFNNPLELAKAQQELNIAQFGGLKL